MKIEAVAMVSEVRSEPDPYNPFQGRATILGRRQGAPAMTVDVDLTLSRDDLKSLFPMSPDRKVKVTIEIE